MGLSLDDIKRLYSVDPETGQIYGRLNPPRPLGWIKPGSPSTGGGYRMIAVWVNGKRQKVRAHQNAWDCDLKYRDADNELRRFRVSGFSTPDAAYETASNFAKSAHGSFYCPGKR